MLLFKGHVANLTVWASSSMKTARARETLCVFSSDCNGMQRSAFHLTKTDLGKSLWRMALPGRLMLSICFVVGRTVISFHFFFYFSPYYCSFFCFVLFVLYRPLLFPGIFLLKCLSKMCNIAIISIPAVKYQYNSERQCGPYHRSRDPQLFSNAISKHNRQLTMKIIRVELNERER